jgi:ribosomal protein S18 acetylase RimI-like enzyme
LAQLARWGVRVRYADGALPAPGVYGLPRPWPHVRAAFERAGFRHTGDTEVVLIAEVAELRRPPAAPWSPGFVVRRSVGACGTRPAARDGDRELGFIEVDTMLDRPERRARGGGLADIGNLYVEPDGEVDGVADRLLAHAAEWLHPGGTDRVLGYESAAEIASITPADRGRLPRTRPHRPRLGTPATCGLVRAHRLSPVDGGPGRRTSFGQGAGSRRGRPGRRVARRRAGRARPRWVVRSQGVLRCVVLWWR